MLKQTVKYTDFNGEEQEEDFYFNLTKAEIIELEMMREGGLSETLKKIVATQDGKGIITEFKNIILVSYGEKSDDGKRFIKSQEVLDRFTSSEAYSEFFMMLLTEPDAAANFIKAVIPQAMVDEVAASLTDEAPIQKNPEVITRAELNTMSPNDKARVMVSVENGEAIIDENI